MYKAGRCCGRTGCHSCTDFITRILLQNHGLCFCTEFVLFLGLELLRNSKKSRHTAHTAIPFFLRHFGNVCYRSNVGFAS